MTRITRTIMTQTMTPARNRSSTMKIKLMTMAITRPLETVDTQVKTRLSTMLFHGSLYG